MSRLDSKSPLDKTASRSGSDPYSYYGSAQEAYGVSGSPDVPLSRSLQDYALILRERAWYIALVFGLVFASAAVYTFTRIPQFESTASVQVFRRDQVVMQVQNVVDNDIRSAEDLNTQVKVLESLAIIQRVADRLQGNDRRRFLAPYPVGEDGSPPDVAGIIFSQRKIVPQRLSLLIQVKYRHPDPIVAAKVANLFVDEYISYNSRLRIEDTMKAVEELKVHAEQQKQKVEELAVGLQAYRERNQMVSLDQRKDIVTEKLKALNTRVTDSNAKLNEAEARWQQVQERIAKPAQLLELPFIASNPLITQLVQQVAERKIAIAELQEQYRARHPKMIEAVNALAQVERELERATLSAAAAVEADYQNARRNDLDARTSLGMQEKESLELDRHAVEYSNLERELTINEHLLNNILARMRETSMTGSIETQNARVVDRAKPEDKPVSPRVLLNLALGLVGGLGLGVGFAFFVAYIDDRVKSSHDIEAIVGLPLVGIIPEIKGLTQPEKAQVVANSLDRHVAESFLTLHSSLRLKDHSKDAQTILVTSTVPGEGKSFLTTNLALTFASHGEKVVIVDCDLRKPNIHRSFGLANSQGTLDICTGTKTLDQVVHKAVHPNLDIIASGGRAKNPTQVLNGKAFEQFVADLRKRYDRVFFDTPPLAAVSDALIILPMVDGSLFSIFFNRVHRKSAQFSARRLMESNVPCFGAVLNGLNLAISGYYYAQYYDKSYKNYYADAAGDEAARS
jgi:succinoglycan biosynthesis transport protein ExoP